MPRVDALESVSRAIWAAEWEEPYPPPGTIERALVEQMAKAAIGAMADALLADHAMISAAPPMAEGGER